MRWVAPGVEITDRYRLHLGCPQNIDSFAEGVTVKRNFDSSVGAEPFAHAEPQMPWHELYRWWQAKVVAVVLEPLAHLDDIAMPFGGQQTGARALQFEQRVGCHGRAVNNAFGLRQQHRAIEPKPRRQCR